MIPFHSQVEILGVPEETFSEKIKVEIVQIKGYARVLFFFHFQYQYQVASDRASCQNDTKVKSS